MATPDEGHRPRLEPVHGGRDEDGLHLSVLWWPAPTPLRAVSTSLVGGGIGPMAWYLNAQVAADYARLDPERHLEELAAAAGLTGPGVGMLTAVDVRTVEYAAEDGVEVLATVGLGWPTWAAGPLPAPGADGGPPPPGTVNLLVVVPDALGDAALVNLLATATEAKVQALVEAGVAGTGTASDALCVACLAGVGSPDGRDAANTAHGPDAAAVPAPGDGDDDGRRRFGGPRSYWGARVARAVHRAVLRGAAADWDRAIAHGWPRPPRHGG